MALRLYTKTGDKGQTSLLGGGKVSKSHIRITAYGEVDELNSFVGLLSDKTETSEEIRQQLIWIQGQLFNMGSLLSATPEFHGFELPQITKDSVSQLEKWIDKFSTEVPELKNFLLPRGHETISLSHVCRTVCRRAERSIISLASEEQIDDILIVFINRLSDYFFIVARKMAQIVQVSETPWTPQS